MAYRHRAQKEGGGREHQYGNKEVFAAAAKGNASGVSATAAKGRGAIGRKHGGAVAAPRLDRRARGGRLKKSPFSMAHDAKGG